MMKTIFMLNCGFMVGLLILLSISFINAYNTLDSAGYFVPRNAPSMTHKYDRMDEVKKECSSVLASAIAVRPTDNVAYIIREEMSFVNGDWWQDLNGSPLMPFDDTEVSASNTSLNSSSQYVQSPLHLVSFWVTDVGRAHQSKNWVRVSGVLQMGISLWRMFDQTPDEVNPRFNIWPSHSELSVSFQGVYTESEGEKVVCLLGNTFLPTRYPDSTNQWEWMKEGYKSQPPLSQDDQILLVLRYPRMFTLTNRAIQGSIRSLNLKSNSKYFDQVHISSCLGSSATYEFGSEKILARACNPYPYNDTLLSSGIDVYKGLDFCLILERFTRQEAFDIIPNWRCKGTYEFCSKLGPFGSDILGKATNGSFNEFKLVLQDVRCEQMSSKDTTGLKVAAVFRAFPTFESPFKAAQRTGLNNMTLSAEGIWKPSSGQLCMVGCQGNHCDSRICLHVPLLFSIEQRSIIVGTFSSIDDSLRSYFPLTFKKPVRPSELYNQYTASRPYYKYTKIVLAGTVLEKNEPFNFGTVIKRSFLTFPRVEDADSFQLSLSYLSEDLTLQISAVPDPVPSYRSPRTDIQMEILSLGPLFGRYWSSQNESIAEEYVPYHAKAESTERQLLLNVSAQLVLTGISFSNFSTLSVEGLYDQHVGKMYLIGCRDVGASWKLLSESMDLEAGLDCLIEVVVSYPPTTTRWLVNPTARVSISSQRTEDDPLYFHPIKLQTFPLMYRKQREDILSRRGVEGIFRVLTLSVAIACILSQLFYIKNNLDSVPYISLVMLGVQALGYGLPLITGAEALFQKSKESFESPSYDLRNSQLIRVIDYSVKLLVLVSFSLTLRLYQKVWRSRIRLLMRSPLEPHRVPSDKWVFLVTLVVHIIGYGSVIIIHSMKTSTSPILNERYLDSTGNFHNLREWETKLEEYVGLVQDFFLLPQVLANIIWQINCKPLRNIYFIGVSVVRLLPHIYDFIRSPVPNPYFSEDYEFVNPHMDFYSKFGDVAIPATAVLLAVAIYIQQKWSYEKLSQTLIFGKFKLLPFRSRVYERLPSVTAEAELASPNAAMRKELEEE